MINFNFAREEMRSASIYHTVVLTGLDFIIPDTEHRIPATGYVIKC